MHFSLTNFKRKAGSQLNDARLARFQQVGHDLFASGAITSHGGNISECAHGQLFISRSNAMLAHLSTDDIITCYVDPLPGEEVCDSGASRELVVHRAIYQAIRGHARKNEQHSPNCAAIVHAHTPHTIMHSMTTDAIEPFDSESRYTFGGPVPVVRIDDTCKVASVEAAEKIAATLLVQAQEGRPPIAVLEEHGPFACATTLPEALRLITALEMSITMEMASQKN